MTEKKSLLVLNQEIRSDLLFCRDCAESQCGTGLAKDFNRLLDKNEGLNNALIEQVYSQPKLSIPKKIAEELLDEDRVKHTSYELMFYNNGDWSGNLQNWMENTDKWWFIVDVYLAGKALGIELVKVIDG